MSWKQPFIAGLLCGITITAATAFGGLHTLATQVTKAQQRIDAIEQQLSDCPLAPTEPVYKMLDDEGKAVDTDGEPDMSPAPGERP